MSTKKWLQWGVGTIVCVLGLALVWSVYPFSTCHPARGDSSRFAAVAPLDLARSDTSTIEFHARPGCSYQVGVLINRDPSFLPRQNRDLPFSVRIAISGLQTRTPSCERTHSTFEGVLTRSTERGIHFCWFDVPRSAAKNGRVRVTANVVQPSEAFVREFGSKGLYAIVLSDF